MTTRCRQLTTTGESEINKNKPKGTIMVSGHFFLVIEFGAVIKYLLISVYACINIFFVDHYFEFIITFNHLLSES